MRFIVSSHRNETENMLNWFKNLWPRSLGQKVASIVAVVVIVLFVVLAIVGIRSYFKAKKALIDMGSLDQKIYAEIEEDKQNKGRRDTIEEYHERKVHSECSLGNVGRVFFIVASVLLGLAIVGGSLFNNRTDGSTLSWFGNNAFIIVTDDSMASVANNNFSSDTLSYLTKNEYRIETNSLISITKDSKATSDLKQYQVIAYRYYDASAKKASIKLGRILSILDDSYQVMADNETVEMTVCKEKKETDNYLLGVFGSYSETTGQVVAGFHSVALGGVIGFFQSALTIVSIFALILIGAFILDYRRKIYRYYQERYYKLLKERLSFESAEKEHYAEDVWYYVDIFEEADKQKEDAIRDDVSVQVHFRKYRPSSSPSVRNVPVTVYKLPEVRMDVKGTLKADGYVYFDAVFKKGCYMLSSSGDESLPFAGYIIKGKDDLFTVDNCLGTAQKNGCTYFMTEKEEALIYIGKENEKHSLKYKMMNGKDKKRYLMIEIDAPAKEIVEEKKDSLPYGSFHKNA